MIVEIVFAGGLISALILAVVSIGGIIKAISTHFRTGKEKVPVLNKSGA